MNTMDGQGENVVPNGANNQAPFNSVPSNNPSYNGTVAPQNNASLSDGNVAQHILGDNQPQPAAPVQTIDSLAQPSPTITPPTNNAMPITSADVNTGTTSISSADVAPVDPAEAARIHAALGHPYFSNHPTQTSASGIGDIVIGERTVKRRFPRPILFAIIGVVALLAIVGIALAASGAFSDGVTKQEVIESFTTYENFAQHGPESYTDDQRWYILDLANSDKYSNQEQAESMNTAQDLLNKFTTNLNASPLSSNDRLQRLLGLNSGMVRTMANYDELYSLADENRETYLADGLDAAQERIAQIAVNSDEASTKVMNTLLTNYLETDLEIIQNYSSHGCVEDGMLNSECVFAIEDEQLDFLITSNDNLSDRLASQYASLVDSYIQNMTLIREGLNE